MDAELRAAARAIRENPELLEDLISHLVDDRPTLEVARVKYQLIEFVEVIQDMVRERQKKCRHVMHKSWEDGDYVVFECGECGYRAKRLAT